MIRFAREADLPLLPCLERAAGAAFAEIGMAAVADDPPLSVAELRRYQRAGRAWVFVDDDRPVAYILVDLVDAAAHIEQVSVRPDFARRGVGRQLIDTVEQWARRRGVQQLTLTTFVDVPWNGPYYERLGFRFLPDDQLSAGLGALRRHEGERGLDAWPRAAMVRDC